MTGVAIVAVAVGCAGANIVGCNTAVKRMAVITVSVSVSSASVIAEGTMA